jgi:2,3-diketo-5-methylthio-1-phosphopentane phosphatase
MALKLFVDFDGTITRTDVGDQFFLTFGGPLCQAVVDDYHAGIIGARECFRREAAAIASLRNSTLEDFLARQEQTPGFGRLLSYCRDADIDVTVVSDGLDLYIRKIFALHGIDGPRVFSNRATLTPRTDGTQGIALEFPYGCAECDQCACCKRNVLLTEAGEEDIIAYVGEGFSDRCAVEYADIVFAKDGLQRYCQEKNISHYLYGDFHHVVERLESLLRRNRLRKRKRAELKRRAAFLSEG